MLRLKPHDSISAPTASATFNTAGSTVLSAIHDSLGLVRFDRLLLARRDADDVATFARQLADDRGLLTPAIDDLDDLALRQSARRTNRHARFTTALELACGDAQQRFDIDRHHELDAHRAGWARRQIIEHDLAELAVLAELIGLALIDIDRDELLIDGRRRE